MLRHVAAAYPNHIWGIDITYIPLKAGWLYLVAILDWFSRLILSWRLSQTLELDFVLQAVDEALLLTTPKIWNSDQGSHFTSLQYLERLLAHQVQISMDGRGRARDNIFTERLRTIQYEEVYLREYASPKEAYRNLSDYICFYNYERPHQALDYQPPAQAYGACTPRMPVVHSIQTLTNHYTLTRPISNSKKPLPPKLTYPITKIITMPISKLGCSWRMSTCANVCIHPCNT